MNNTMNTRLGFLKVEELIENRIAAEREVYDLDAEDIADIRLECYKANGWSFDPFPMEDEEEEAEEDATYRSMSDRLAEICMSERDFY